MPALPLILALSALATPRRPAAVVTPETPLRASDWLRRARRALATVPGLLSEPGLDGRLLRYYAAGYSPSGAALMLARDGLTPR